jgi:hypothetical protein
MELFPLPLDPLIGISITNSSSVHQSSHEGHTGSRLDSKIDAFEYFNFLPTGICEVNIVELDRAITARRERLTDSKWDRG